MNYAVTQIALSEIDPDEDWDDNEDEGDWDDEEDEGDWDDEDADE